MTESLMTVTEYCGSRDISRKAFYEHRRDGRLKGCFRKKPGGKRQLVVPAAADKALSERVRFNAGGEATRAKHRGEKPPAAGSAEPITDDEIRHYLSEDIESLEKLDMAELQKRFEIEKILAARLKRRKDSREVIDAALVQARAFEAGKAIKESCLAIPDRVSPLMAAEPDAFKCKRILLEEINYILEGLAEKLAVQPIPEKGGNHES